MAKFKIINDMCRQSAVYWAPLSIGDNGEWVFAPPIQLRVRWEGYDALHRMSDGASEKHDLTKIVVYVLQDVKVGGVLWPGTLAQCPTVKKTSPYDPFAGDELAKEISRFATYPTLKADQVLRVATLS